ncbi:MAG: GGDEF domain-containing protein [Lachnospiraceae bacterium]|nr:GGDEF domain-containing protein [Lachnospiraceae bacterium]MBQ3600144.1 GGDEF domain-containing protein [Lachnospiraceae bacterium]
MKNHLIQSHHFKITKIVQAGIIIATLVIFIFLLLLNSDFRMSLFRSPLAILSTMLLWSFFLANVIFIILDFRVFYKTLQVSDEIQHAAYLDDLTGMPNRFSCDLVFQMYAEPEKIQHVGCALIEIDNLITTNEQLGREAGNQILIDFSNILEEIGSDYGFVGRNGGNEFLLVVENGNKQSMENFFNEVHTRLKRYNALELNNPIKIYYKYVLNDELHANRFSDIITEVYKLVHNRNE